MSRLSPFVPCVTVKLPNDETFTYSGSTEGVTLGSIQATDQAVDQAWNAYLNAQGSLQNVPAGSSLTVTQGTNGLNLGINAAPGTSLPTQTITIAPKSSIQWRRILQHKRKELIHKQSRLLLNAPWKWNNRRIRGRSIASSRIPIRSSSSYMARCRNSSRNSRQCSTYAFTAWAFLRSFSALTCFPYSCISFCAVSGEPINERYVPFRTTFQYFSFIC